MPLRTWHATCNTDAPLSLSGGSSLNEYLALLSGIARAVSGHGPLLRLMAAHSPEEAAACFSPLPGHYRSGFTSLFAPLVPSPIYEIAWRRRAARYPPRGRTRVVGSASSGSSGQ
jgi:hypothetical protein